jgi:hypothetical protein
MKLTKLIIVLILVSSASLSSAQETVVYSVAPGSKLSNMIKPISIFDNKAGKNLDKSLIKSINFSNTKLSYIELITGEVISRFEISDFLLEEFDRIGIDYAVIGVDGGG